VSLLYSSYCLSDTSIQYGSTNNAASSGLMWTMANILPQQAGLQVNGVFYQYTTVKNTEDDMLVHVQNENARGDGYIFRETDDWSGLPGNTIKKQVPVDLIDISYWGDGSIEVDGFGSVKDPTVVYTYQFDPCFDPQSRPDCPGYKDPFVMSLDEVKVTDPLDEDYVQNELDRKAVMDDEDQEDRDRRKVKSKKKLDKRLEKVLGIVNTTVLAGMAQAKHSELMAMSYLPTSYIESSLDGGTYEDAVVLDGGDLSDSKVGLRSTLMQQLKHKEMVDLQYELKTKENE